MRFYDTFRNDIVSGKIISDGFLRQRKTTRENSGRNSVPSYPALNRDGGGASTWSTTLSRHHLRLASRKICHKLITHDHKSRMGVKRFSEIL